MINLTKSSFANMLRSPEALGSVTQDERDPPRHDVTSAPVARTLPRRCWTAGGEGWPVGTDHECCIGVSLPHVQASLGHWHGAGSDSLYAP